jgi:dUTP pyrophosphatase
MSKTVDILTTAIGWAMQGAPFGDVANKLKELDECHVKVWREDETVKLPTYAKSGDACMDVYVHKVEFKPDGRVVYHTGLHFALPEDYEMTIRPRSSNTKTTAVMQNSPGTLDGGYRGELLIVMRDMIDPSLGNSEYGIGDRCAQISIRRRERIVWEEVKTLNELGETDRGQGGFGSTNK